MVRRKFIYSLVGKEVTDFPRTNFPVEAAISDRHISVPFTQMFPFPAYATTPTQPEMVKDMIEQLPSSLHHLLKNVEVLVSKAEIVQQLDQQQSILLARDGTAIPGRASYGWIRQIGTTQIAKGKGPAFGDDPRLFCAKGYGMVSAFQYLRLLQRQTDFRRDRQLVNKLICDNQGLLTRIAEASKWNYTTPNVTLRAEWDIESVILSVLKETQIRFAFVHVKSHQDDDTPTTRLSLESHLNVEAD
jgi:hypothetical protein